MTDKPESETTAGLSVGEVLPVVAWLSPFGSLASAHMLQQHMKGWTDLTPHAPAQATISSQAAEIERKSDAIQRLWKERDELRAEFAALKAKQVADIDETMRLADAISYADVCCVLTAETKAYHENYRIKDAARKALRAHLAKDRT